MRDGHVTRPDKDGLRLHVEAEKRLRAEGKVNAYGDLEYEAKHYMRVLEAIQAEERLSAAAA